MEIEGSGAWGKAAAVVLCRYTVGLQSILLLPQQLTVTQQTQQFSHLCGVNCWWNKWCWVDNDVPICTSLSLELDSAETIALEQLISTAPLCTFKSTTLFDENLLELELEVWSRKLGSFEVYFKEWGYPSGVIDLTKDSDQNTILKYHHGFLTC